jgi:tetratricopeptide (TPR) repeat protein
MPMRIYAEVENQSLDEQELKLDQDIATLKKNLSELKGYEENAKKPYIENKDLKDTDKKIQKLKDENLELKNKIIQIEDAMAKDMASLYQELGTAYVQAKLFGLAIDAYTKALKLTPGNAEVHYNIGLLYQHSRDNPKKALYHLKKYLQFNPEARNRKDVESLIEMLQEAPILEPR